MHSFLLKTINKPLQLDLSGSSGGYYEIGRPGGLIKNFRIKKIERYECLTI